MKFFSPGEKAALASKLAIQEGDLILFAAGPWLTACEILGKIRLYAADILRAQGKLTIPADRYDFLWVVDFPLLSFDKEQDRWYSTHHPFTAPVAEDISLLKTDPRKVRGQHYDIVVNGVELGGGSIRIHQPDVQKTVFEEGPAFPPTKPNSALATCSRPSATAPRPMAASPWASTASLPSSAAPRASAMSSPSPKPPKALVS